MKKFSYFRMITAVVIGIIAVLLLTLNIWGSEWYKVTLSILLGVIIGIFVIDPRNALTIIKDVFKETWEAMRKMGLFITTVPERIKVYRISKQPGWLRYKEGEDKKRWEKIERRRKLATGFYYLLRALPLILFVVFFIIDSTTVKTIGQEITALKGFKFIQEFIPLSIAIILMIFFSICFSFHGWREIIGLKRLKKIFRNQAHVNKCIEDYWLHDYHNGKDVIEDLTHEISLIKVIAYILFLDLFTALIFVTRLCKSFFIKTFMVFLMFLNIVFISLPLLIVLFLKKIADNGILLSASASIVFGGIIGSWTKSYPNGIFAGLGFLGILFAHAFFLKKVEPFFSFKDGSYIDRLSNIKF